LDAGPIKKFIMSQLKNINFKKFVKEKKLANERIRIKFDRKKEGQIIK
jgi:cytoplasmic iron level regulating protein YaaA (DUF328/UPF0246 family)